MPLPTPFPLASGRYETGPSMRRLGQDGETTHFQPDDHLAATLSVKLAALRRAPGESHLTAPNADETGLLEALQETFRLLAAECPTMVTADDDSVTLHHLGLRLVGWSRLEPAGDPWPELLEIAAEVRRYLAEQEGIRLVGAALGLAVQEDLAIVRGPVDQTPDLLEWLNVCLPSNWVPAEKIGGTFGAVHTPVVHSERLLGAQSQIVRAMVHAGPFVRYVWGIHRDGALCHNPRIHQAAPWGADPVRQAYFRVERQTTHGFPALNRALFTIRYWVEPLTETATDPWRRERLAEALAHMDDAELAYKGLAAARNHLVDWLRS